MKNIISVLITLVLSSCFVWAYYLFAQAVLAQSVRGMDGPGRWGLFAGVSYFIWLSSFAGNALGLSGGPGSKISHAAKTNLKVSIVALVLCFPTAFIFIGLIAPPFIIGSSAVALAIAIIAFKNHGT